MPPEMPLLAAPFNVSTSVVLGPSRRLARSAGEGPSPAVRLFDTHRVGLALSPALVHSQGAELGPGSGVPSGPSCPHQAFFTDRYLQEHPEAHEKIEKLKDLIAWQVSVGWPPCRPDPRPPGPPQHTHQPAQRPGTCATVRGATCVPR